MYPVSIQSEIDYGWLRGYGRIDSPCLPVVSEGQLISLGYPKKICSPHLSALKIPCK